MDDQQYQPMGYPNFSANQPAATPTEHVADEAPAFTQYPTQTLPHVGIPVPSYEPITTQETEEQPVQPAAMTTKVGGEAEASSEPVSAEANKTRICLKALKAIERDLQNVIRLLETQVNGTNLAEGPVSLSSNIGNGNVTANGNGVVAPAVGDLDLAGFRQQEGRVIEGVFDGQNMVGSDGKTYTVPANYASKSKLVEGDMLKLTITPRGSFIYKQIGPIERSRIVGALGFDQTLNEYYVTFENKRWSVIKASVTYFKGEPGDEVILLVPKNAPSKWGAVENIIKAHPLA